MRPRPAGSHAVVVLIGALVASASSACASCSGGAEPRSADDAALDATADAPLDATADAVDGGGCEAHGGACVGVGACGRGAGHLGTDPCAQGHDVVCCFPQSACGGAETFDCCAGSASFRPSCVGGVLACAPGQTTAPVGGCFADAGAHDAGG